jgi:hypothetical protein
MSDDTLPGGIDPEAYDAAEDLDVLEAEDSRNPDDDPLDEGYSPPEHPLGMREELTLDQRLAEEEPEPEDDPDAEDVGGDNVGDRRTGRLAGDPDDDALTADDVGIDGGAASAEEAAVHTIEPEVDAGPGSGGDGVG